MRGGGEERRRERRKRRRGEEEEERRRRKRRRGEDKKKRRRGGGGEEKEGGGGEEESRGRERRRERRRDRGEKEGGEGRRREEERRRHRRRRKGPDIGLEPHLVKRTLYPERPILGNAHAHGCTWFSSSSAHRGKKARLRPGAPHPHTHNPTRTTTQQHHNKRPATQSHTQTRRPATHTHNQKKKYQHPGSNWRPPACEAGVITNYTMPAFVSRNALLSHTENSVVSFSPVHCSLSGAFASRGSHATCRSSAIS